MSAILPAAQTMRLDEYAPLVGTSEIQELRTLAARLSGRAVQMVNTTAVGGGVAEMLNRLVPLLQELGLSTRWDVMTGGEDFFAVTKAFHNALHGGDYEPRLENFQTYLQNNQQTAQRLTFDSDFTVIHDPQPAALIRARGRNQGRWFWRCHIDLSHPNPGVWDFLAPFVCEYDGALFSSPQFTRQLPIPQYLFFPSIDPLSEKNRDLEPGFIHSVLSRFGVDPSRPILTQISRFDRLKDPVGVLQVYRIVKRYADCQLILAGGSASDDPEGGTVLQQVQETAAHDPDVHVLELPPWSALEINALQRGSTVVLQKSIREGFGLTVTEALWKQKPVVAAAVGGIPAQIIHKQTGLLSHSIEGTAYHVRFLLSNPSFAQRLGEQGKEHVRENFLITSNLKRYLTLFLYASPPNCF